MSSIASLNSKGQCGQNDIIKDKTIWGYPRYIRNFSNLSGNISNIAGVTAGFNMSMLNDNNGLIITMGDNTSGQCGVSYTVQTSNLLFPRYMSLNYNIYKI